MKYCEMILSNVSRRNFLIYTGMSSCLFLLDPLKDTRILEASPDRDYYVSNKEKFMASFETTVTNADPYLKIKYGGEIAREICRSARNEFIHLLPDLPYIGGDQHPGTRWLLLAGHWISFLRPMKEKGYSTESAAHMMYDLYEAHLNTIPKGKMTKRGNYMFTQEYMDIMKNWAQKSKGQNVDWVADFIPKNGDAFDYGIDYHYCPCFEYFTTQGAKEISPYFCLVDFPEHKVMGTGLVRTKTLAQGNDVCNFRYKKGRKVTQNWSTEAPKFRANS